MPAPRLLTVKQAAEYLTLSAGAVYDLCRGDHPKLRHHRLGVDGGTIRITQDQCDQYLRESEAGPVIVTASAQKVRLATGLQHLPLPRKMRESLKHA